MTAFEDFVNLELPRRSAFLTYEITSYDGDPNSGSSPAILQGAPKGTWFLQQTGSIYWRKRTSASDSWVIANLNATYEEMDIYVRAADGSDTNPGTSALPLATLQAAIDKIPFFVNHAIRIHVGPHTGSGYLPPSFRMRKLNANIWIIGDGANAVGEDGFTEIVSSTVALSGSTNLKIVSSGLSASEFGGFGEHFGRTVEILTGAAAGDRRTIKSNTATDINVNLEFSATISAGDTYRIVEPKAIIYLSPPYDKLIEQNGYSTKADFNKNPDFKINFVNFKIGDSGSRPDLEIINSTVAFWGIELIKGATFRGYSATIYSGLEVYNYPNITCPSTVIDLGVGSDTEWTGWGVSCRSVSTTDILYITGVDFIGIAHGYSFTFAEWSRSLILTGSFWGNYAISVGSWANVTIFGLFSQTLIGSNGKANGILINNNGILNLSSLLADGIYIRGNNGLRCRNNSTTYIDAFAASAIKFENPTIGFQTELGSTILMGSNLPTMVCGGNDFSMDSGYTVLAISELISNSLFANVAHGRIER